MPGLIYSELSEHIHHYVFIVNPVSGTRGKRQVEQLIRNQFKDRSYQLLFTQSPGHAMVLASQFKSDKNTCIIAVGGDGTINEIAQSIVSQPVKLGIIPRGSGNGFAGHALGNKSIKDYLQTIKNPKIASCDVILINGQICCNTAGFGLSGYVAKLFNEKGERGLFNYVRLGLREFKNITKFNVLVDELVLTDLINIEIANSSQLGNKAFVSPNSSIQDGLAELVMLKKPQFSKVPGIILDLFTKNLQHHSAVQIISRSSARIVCKEPYHYHIDGEYRGTTDHIDFKVINNALNLII
ncbi:MAG: diacylglycerol kinase family protein [Saprospiraceae bacterium]